VRGLGRSM